METKNFVYIENFAVILLNSNIAEGIEVNHKPAEVKKTQNLITSFFQKMPTKTAPTLPVVPTDKHETEKNKKEDYSHFNKINPVKLLNREQCEYFHKSKRVLLMFRRVKNFKNSHGYK